MPTGLPDWMSNPDHTLPEIHEDDWDDNETVYVIKFEVAPQSK